VRSDHPSDSWRTATGNDRYRMIAFENVLKNWHRQFFVYLGKDESSRLCRQTNLVVPVAQAQAVSRRFRRN
jgi:hypothetical protein